MQHFKRSAIAPPRVRHSGVHLKERWIFNFKTGNLIMFFLSPATVSLPATIVTSSMPPSMAGHMMYSSPHTVMYASAPTLADGGLAVLNAFSQGSSAMHGQAQDSGLCKDGGGEISFNLFLVILWGVPLNDAKRNYKNKKYFKTNIIKCT